MQHDEAEPAKTAPSQEVGGGLRRRQRGKPIGAPGGKRRGRVGELYAAWRFLRNRESGIPTKLLCLLSVLYVVVPTDAVSDLLPVVGWLDDVGVVAFASAWLLRKFRNSPAGERLEDAASEGPNDD